MHRALLRPRRPAFPKGRSPRALGRLFFRTTLSLLCTPLNTRSSLHHALVAPRSLCTTATPPRFRKGRSPRDLDAAARTTCPHEPRKTACRSASGGRALFSRFPSLAPLLSHRALLAPRSTRAHLFRRCTTLQLSLHHALLAPRSLCTTRFFRTKRRDQYNGESSTGERGVQGERRTSERGVHGEETRTAERGSRLPPTSRLSADFTPFRRLHALPPTSRHPADLTPSRRVHAFSPRSCLPSSSLSPSSSLAEFTPFAERESVRLPKLAPSLDARPLSSYGPLLGYRASVVLLCRRAMRVAVKCALLRTGPDREAIFPALKFPGRFPGSRVRQAARGKSREACASAACLTFLL